MKKIVLSRRGKIVASVLSGALVVGGCGGAALALTAGPGIGVIDEFPLGGGDGLSRYVLTLEPSVDATLLDDAALASAVVPMPAAAAQQAPVGAESLGPGGRIVQIAGTAYYVTDLGGVAVTPGASTAVLSPVEMAQWASQNGVQLDLPGTSRPSAPIPAPQPSATREPSTPSRSGPVTDAQLEAIRATPGVVVVQRLGDQVHVAGDITLAEAQALPGVVEAEPSAEGNVHATIGDTDSYAKAYGWSLENRGTAYMQDAKAGVDVSAADGWLSNRGEGTVIAVVDTGFDSDHEDLVGTLWTNPDCGSDADGDGIRGDCHGWNFYRGNADVDNGAGGSHGTTVSGNAAAAENGVGTIGVAPRALLMPLVIGSEGTVDMNLGARAIRYAADHGATVVNASWGGYLSGSQYRTLAAAVDYAASKGVLVVASAGNDGGDRDQDPLYPSAMPNASIISVGNSTAMDVPASNSAYGARSVDLYAPGYRIISPYNDGGYRFMSGTSMSAPHVAAAVALYRNARPDLTALQVKDQIMADATRVPAFAGKSVTGARLDLANLGASASGAQYSFSGMTGVAGTVTPQVGVTATTGAGDYALSLGLAMQVDGEPWAVTDAPITLAGQTVTTDDDGFATFPLGSLTDFGTRSFAPGLSLGDGTYALVAQLSKGGTPVGRPFAAPLLVRAAASEQAPGTSNPGTSNPGTSDPGTSNPGTSNPGTSNPGTDQPGTSNPGTSNPGTDQPGTSNPGTSNPGTSNPGTDQPGTSNPGTSSPGTSNPGTDQPGLSNPGGGSPSPEPTSSTRPEVPSSDPTPSSTGGGRGGDRGDSPAPSSTPSPSGTRTYDSAGDFDITSLTPTVVGTAGGTSVTALGRGLSFSVTVRVGDADAHVISAHDGDITFLVPARPAGTYNVVLSRPGRVSTLPDAITYRDSDSGSGGGSNPGTSNPGSSDPGGGGGGGGGGGTNPGSSNPGTSNPGTSNPGTSNPGTSNPGGGGTNPGSTTPGGSSSPAPTTRTGPNGERLTKSAKLSGVGYVWSTQCRTTCTGTRL